jgi:hypothetical protein
MKKIIFGIAVALYLILCNLSSHAQWKIDRNKIVTGSLMFVAGGAKGFNETLQFHYDNFKKVFPGANDHWFNPDISWQNKYKHNDPAEGARFPLSTSVLVFVTDQYHLNNFIQRAGITAAIVLKIGHKQKFKYYVYDFLYYTACYQAGFALTYYSFKK